VWLGVDRHDADAVAEFGKVEAVAEVAGHVVDADHAEHQADAGHQQRAHQRRRRHVGEEDQAEHQQRGVFRRPEFQGDGSKRRRHHGEGDDAECAGDPGTDRGDAQRGAGPALFGHGVAVDTGHHRRGLAGNAHQDRGGRAAILRAVIDAGQHDDRLRGVEPEGDRQKNRDARQGANARQHADQSPDQAAEKGVPEIVGLEGDGKTMCQA
jgi:hypothetical protein